jgi:hypothetical protein
MHLATSKGTDDDNLAVIETGTVKLHLFIPFSAASRERSERGGEKCAQTCVPVSIYATRSSSGVFEV